MQHGLEATFRHAIEDIVHLERVGFVDPLTNLRLPVFVIAVVGDNLQQNENGTLNHPFFLTASLDSLQTVVGIVESVTECAFVEPISRPRKEFLDIGVLLQVKIALLPKDVEWKEQEIARGSPASSPIPGAL